MGNNSMLGKVKKICHCEIHGVCSRWLGSRWIEAISLQSVENGEVEIASTSPVGLAMTNQFICSTCRRPSSYSYRYPGIPRSARHRSRGCGGGERRSV